MREIGIVFLVAIAIVFGEWVGVRDYKAQCEPMSSNPYHIEWLECK